MLLYPISGKGTLLLDNLDHGLKYSFMFAIKHNHFYPWRTTSKFCSYFLMKLPEGISSSEEGDTCDQGKIFESPLMEVNNSAYSCKNKEFLSLPK